MIGNPLGWVMSAAILALVALLIVLGGQPPAVTPPTGQFVKYREKAASTFLSVDPHSLGVGPGVKDCDAGDLYHKVIGDYKANKFRYKNHYEDSPDSVKNLKKDMPQCVQWVVDAADCKTCNLFIHHPQEVVNYDNEQDSIVALRAVGLYLDQIAASYLIEKSKDFAPNTAEPYLRGAFVLGLRMYDERLRWQEYYMGTELMNGAANGMIKVARANGETARADQLFKFVESMATYEKNATPLWKVISGIGTDAGLPNPGDVIDFAQNSQEPMWQTEAILKLGRMRFMDNLEVGDQRGANRIVTKLAERTDLAPGPKAAADAAHGLTRERFRMIGGGS